MMQLRNGYDWQEPDGWLIEPLLMVVGAAVFSLVFWAFAIYGAIRLIAS